MCLYKLGCHYLLGPQHCSIILSHRPNFLQPLALPPFLPAAVFPLFFRKTVGCQCECCQLLTPALTLRKDPASLASVIHPLILWMPFFAPRRPGFLRYFYSLFPMSSPPKSAFGSPLFLIILFFTMS